MHSFRRANDRRPAAFFDRDGTLIEDCGYCVAPNQVRLLPGAAAAVARVRNAGYMAIVVTNQSAIARGLATAHQVEACHRRLRDLLRETGGDLDGFYYCPHHPWAGSDPVLTRPCACRKPGPGMVLQAVREHGISLRHSFIVGDRESDVDVGTSLAMAAYRVGAAHYRSVWDAVEAHLRLCQP